MFCPLCVIRSCVLCIFIFFVFSLLLSSCVGWVLLLASTPNLLHGIRAPELRILGYRQVLRHKKAFNLQTSTDWKIDKWMGGALPTTCILYIFIFFLFSLLLSGCACCVLLLASAPNLLQGIRARDLRILCCWQVLKHKEAFNLQISIDRKIERQMDGALLT